MRSSAIIAIVIIGLGIAGAYFILKNSVALTSIEIKTDRSDNLPSVNSITKPTIENQHSAPPAHIATSQNNSSLNNKGMTEIFAKELGQKIAEQNPGGPEIIDGKQWLNAPNPEDLAQELIGEVARNFDPKSLRPNINDNDIKIASDNSIETARKYLLTFNAIVKKTAEQFPSFIFTDPARISMTTVKQLADIYQSGYEKFSRLEVPLLLLEIHKKELILLGAKANAYKQIYNYENDPVAAFLVTNELNNIDKEFEGLSKTLDAFIQKNNLNS